MKFTLRPWKPEDLNDLLEYANNFSIAQNMTNRFPHPYTEESGKSFIQFATLNTPVNIFAIEIGGRASGGIGLHLQDDIFCKNAELGYWLAQPFWGKGITTNAVVQMIEYGFKTFDIDRIFARPFGTNHASQRVLEKSGFILEAKFEKTIIKNGEYKDELIYAIRKKL
jgi:RimJ/RimL family protein N-acetyltransferase